jgi:phosphoribosylformimino-5-aminoimidazole carboxamide ribotide isomerase
MSTGFELLAAIDLRGGRVVRLVQGDPARETAYATDPVAAAAGIVDAGARWLHLVDLDGARAGEPRQAAIMGSIVSAVGARAGCEIAGGLRSDDSVEAAFRAGARRVVVGTAALADPKLVRRVIAAHGPDAIVVALDVRGGVAIGEGWRTGAPGAPVEETLEDLARLGVPRFEVTAIERDGGMAGPDLALVGRLAALGHGSIIASGGIRTIDDVLAARRVGAAGAIVGRALYETGFDLAAAERAVDAT